jgi:hypothetical protein
VDVCIETEDEVRAGREADESRGVLAVRALQKVSRVVTTRELNEAETLHKQTERRQNSDEIMELPPLQIRVIEKLNDPLFSCYAVTSAEHTGFRTKRQIIVSCIATNNIVMSDYADLFASVASFQCSGCKA